MSASPLRDAALAGLPGLRGRHPEVFRALPPSRLAVLAVLLAGAGLTGSAL